MNILFPLIEVTFQLVILAFPLSDINLTVRTLSSIAERFPGTIIDEEKVTFTYDLGPPNVPTLLEDIGALYPAPNGGLPKILLEGAIPPTHAETATS